MVLGPCVGPVAVLGGTGVVVDGERDPLGLGEEPLRPAEVEHLRLAVEHCGNDPELPQASRRASEADRSWPVSRWAAPSDALSRSVEGDEDGGVDRPDRPSVGRCSSSSSTNARPYFCDQSSLLGPEGVPGRLRDLGRGQPRPSPRAATALASAAARWANRRGEAICWITFLRIWPASVGTVKWPVTVPSRLSCSISLVTSRARCSSLRSRASLCASTSACSRWADQSARLALRRSATGSTRLATATSDLSIAARSAASRPAGSCSAVRAMTCACSVEAAPRPGRPALRRVLRRGRSPAGRPWPQRPRRTARPRGQPRGGAGHPRVPGHVVPVCHGHERELQGLQPVDRSVHVTDQARGGIPRKILDTRRTGPGPNPPGQRCRSPPVPVPGAVVRWPWTIVFEHLFECQPFSPGSRGPTLTNDQHRTFGRGRGTRVGPRGTPSTQRGTHEARNEGEPWWSSSSS